MRTDAAIDQTIEYLQEVVGTGDPTRWGTQHLTQKIKRLAKLDKEFHLGVTYGSPKAVLIDKCIELGIPVDEEQDTKERIMYKLRSYQIIHSPASSDDLVAFGMHRDRTYRQVPQDYLQWATKVYKKDPGACCPEMQRLVKWHLDPKSRSEGQQTRMMRAAPSSTASSSRTGRPGSRTQPTTRPVAGLEDEEELIIPGQRSSQSQHETNMVLHMATTMGELVNAVQHLTHRMTTFEERQPRDMETDMNSQVTDSSYAIPQAAVDSPETP